MPRRRQNEEGEVVTVFRNRWVKFALIAVPCITLLIWLTYRLRGVLIPFGLAVVGAYVLNPVVEYCQAKLKWRRVPVVVVLGLVLTTVLLITLASGVYYTITTVGDLTAAAKEPVAGGTGPEHKAGPIRDAYRRVTAFAKDLGLNVPSSLEDLRKVVGQHLKELMAIALGAVSSLLSSVMGLVVASFNFVVFFVVTAYLLADLPKIRDATRDLLPEKYKSDILRIAGELDTNLRAFFRGQVLVALSLGVIYSVGLMLCGIDFALLIGMIAGIVSVVPYLGIAVGLAPALLFSVVPYTSMWPPMGVLAVFVVGQTIEGLYLTPKIIGRNVGLSPVVVILSVMVFGQLFGALGLIFAVPLAAVVKVLSGELLRYYKAHQAKAGKKSA